MREILFRGKRLDNGEWIEGTPFHRKSFYGSPDDRHFMLTGEELHYDYYEAHEVDPATIGQFTGLRDKDETRIFEGDIVKSVYGEHVASVEAEVWNCGCCYPVFGFSTETTNPGIGDTLEVIGNIHDNPELLEDKHHD